MPVMTMRSATAGVKGRRLPAGTLVPVATLQRIRPITWPRVRGGGAYAGWIRRDRVVDAPPTAAKDRLSDVRFVGRLAANSLYDARRYAIFSGARPASAHPI